jgi:hypothetical protein
MPVDYSYVEDYNRIVLRGDPAYQERFAGGAITPGHLIQIESDDTVIVNGTSDDAAPNLAFALEDVMQGNTIRDAYAANDLTRYAVFASGDQVLGIATSDSVNVGDVVASNGDGTLKLRTAGQAIGQVLFKYTDEDSIVRIIVQVF